MTALHHTLTKSLLAAAVAFVIGMGAADTGYAQDKGGSPDRFSEAKARREAKRAKSSGGDAAGTESGSQQGPMFPLATRVPPPQKVTNAKESKVGKEIDAEYSAKNYAGVISKVEAMVASGVTNPYLLSYGYQLAAVAANNLDDEAKSAAYFKKAVDTNGLDNNGHYQSMYNLAIVQSQLDKNAEALATLDRYMSETKTDKVEALELKAVLLGNLDRAAEGAALYEKILAQRPNDRRTLMNAVALYQQADNFDKANGLLEDARKKGLLTEGSEYRALFVGYANASKFQQAESVLLEGVNKGAIKPGQQLANDYSIIAQNYYNDGKVAQAIDFYGRANKVSTDGEAALNLARVLRNEGRINEAKVAAKEALAKGLKKPKDANMILGLPGGK